MEMNIMGIYKIKNIINGKIYIGSSKDITKRWKQHLSALKNNTHHSYHLQRAWNKYGEENFKFEVVEIIHDEDLLTEKEQEWMTKYTCCDYRCGYNMSYDTNRPTTSRFSHKNSYMLPKDSLLSLNELKISMILRGLFYALCSLCNESNLVTLDEKPMGNCQISDFFNLDRKTINRNFKDLEDFNLIKIKRIGNKNNIHINPNFFIASSKIKEDIYNMFNIDLYD
jgi:group I intron endonuclease